MRGPRNPISREVAAVRRSLSILDKALIRLASQAGKAGREVVKSAARPARKLKLSPGRRKALQLHGRYMGYVRQLKPRAKAQVKALRASKGLKAAIAKARKLAAA
jgi:hypothetical protein